jgi:predicted DNA-binding transcriptional regulator AlpA
MAQAAAADLKAFDTLPESAKARVNTVAALYAVSVPTVWRRVKQGVIPAPHKVGGTSVWRVGELRQALRGEG